MQEGGGAARGIPSVTTTVRMPLGRASLLASSVIREAVRRGLPADSLTVVGGVRRFAPDIGRPSVLCTLPPADRREALHRLSTLPMVSGVLDHTPSMVRLDTFRGALDVHVTDPSHAGAALVWHTGSRRHTRALCDRAARRNLAFGDGVLRDGGGRPLEVLTEEALYRHLDLPCIQPELREGLDEIAAADRGALPGLVSAEHMRGDLHMHTRWSDGRDSIDDMARAARALGYEYVAITDHSERAGCARTMSVSDVSRQRDEIEAVREGVPNLVVLHGVEVDIMQDGSLDFEDAILERFDIVLASLHDHAGHSGEELTSRYLAAIRHPLVNVITHLANRSPGFFDGYDLGFERIFDAAAESGTALEIDGAPGHLDMDGFVARRAVAAGATVTIDSDCHRSDALARQMRFGIGTARRGWIEPEHTLNTRGIESVRTFVASKRARR